MVRQSYTSEKETQTLMGIREGMLVYDRENTKVGTVKYVQLPDESDIPDLGAETMHGSKVDKMPEVLRARLRQEGFVQVDSGLFAPDRYIMPHQIEAVSDDGVKLRVAKDTLIKF